MLSALTDTSAFKNVYIRARVRRSGIDVGIGRMCLYEVASRTHVLAHEHGEYAVGLAASLM